ncbi:MAG: phytanoyl-CoA dioxygenase family protein [Chitinophagales bacterium]|nr:phytanoyl-CoA dioxygenase family protein [Bacteroidota bacterium]
MIGQLYHKLFSKKFPSATTLKERHVQPMYIINEADRKKYIRDGFVVIKNIVSDEIIDKIVETFTAIQKMPGYFESEELQTTIAYGVDAHNLAIETVNSVSSQIFDSVLDNSKCRYDFGGGIIVKNKGGWFAPHQDCSIVDEYKNCTSYAWIPTVDMTSENGTFYAIPGSHLWAAWQRSSQYPSWSLKKFSQFLWNNMQPIKVNKGDVLLFDSALIHASGENKTDKIRLAFNMCIIEKEAEHVQYVKDHKTSKNAIDKYIVDEAYWYSGNLWGRPKGYKKITEQLVYPTDLTESYLLELIQKYNQYQAD